jgi:ectoine hydroxylase-related dioxygenase (phytanoyl-CoA dioxygenase family)
MIATDCGSLEILPGSHRPDGSEAQAPIIRATCDDDKRRFVPVDVGAGSVTVYSSRLWHRGGANAGPRERVFAFLTLTEPSSPAPPGLIHTMTREDVGKWVVGPAGLQVR